MDRPTDIPFLEDAGEVCGDEIERESARSRVGNYADQEGEDVRELGAEHFLEIPLHPALRRTHCPRKRGARLEELRDAREQGEDQALAGYRDEAKELKRRAMRDRREGIEPRRIDREKRLVAEYPVEREQDGNLDQCHHNT